MPRALLPRLPLAPLVAHAGSIKALALASGTHRDVIQHWQRDGGVPFWSADMLATRLGQHPSAFFGQDWWDASAQVDLIEHEAQTHRESMQWVYGWCKRSEAQARREWVREADALENWRARVERYHETREAVA